MNLEKSCGAVVYREAGKNREYLLICHKNGNHWAFPKGHVEAMETEEETARREIQEETGLSVALDTGIRLVTTYAPKPGTQKDVVYFAAKAGYEDLNMQEAELRDIQWLSFANALDTLTYKDAQKILAQVDAYLNK